MEKRNGNSVRHSFVLIAALVTIGAFALSGTTKVLGQTGQDRGWKVWIRTSPCSGRFDWLSIGKEQPPGAGAGAIYYVSYTAEFGNRGCTESAPFGCTFAEAQALMESLRFDPKFSKYCCRDYSVWRDIQTNKYTIVMGRPAQSPGESWLYVKGNLCCVEAEALAGIPGACSGSRTGHSGASCFASDPGMGSTDRDQHYNWAQRQSGAQLEANLKSKIDLLYNCPSLSDDGFADAFADLSVVIANYVQSAACFNGDRGVMGTDRNAHYQWARSKTRRQVYENLQWKMVSAFRCMDAARQKIFFADLSVPAARISPTRPTTTVGSNPGRSRTQTPPPGYTGSNTPGASTPRTGDNGQGTGGDSSGNYNWAGTYSSGNGTMTVSGGGAAVSAQVTWDNGDSKGRDSFNGCAVSGNNATNCQWSGTQEDLDKTTDRQGTCDLTLNGNSIALKCIEGEPRFHVKPGREWSFNQYTSKMRKGAVWTNTYTRNP